MNLFRDARFCLKDLLLSWGYLLTGGYVNRWLLKHAERKIVVVVMVVGTSTSSWLG